MRIRPSLFVVLVLLATPALAALRVAVYEDQLDVGTSADLAAQLADDTFFDFDATLVHTSDLNSAAGLASYDVVILPGTGSFGLDLSPASAAAIAAWATSGRGIVTTGWYDYGSPNDAARDLLTPVDSDASTSDLYCEWGNTQEGITVTASHFVTAGLTAILTTSQNIEVNPLLDGTNAMVLGTGFDAGGCTSSGGAPNALVVGELGAGRTLYVGLMYGATEGYVPDDLRSGNADRLLEQSVAWVAFDEDADSVAGHRDNCPDDANSDQADANMNGVGDACEPVVGDDDDDDDDDGGGSGGGCGCTLAQASASPLGAFSVIALLGAVVFRRRR